MPPIPFKSFSIPRLSPNCFICLSAGLTTPNPKPPKKPAAAASPNCFAKSLLPYNSAKVLSDSKPPAVDVTASCIVSAKASCVPVLSMPLPNSVAVLPMPFLRTLFSISCKRPPGLFKAFTAILLPPNVLITLGTTPPIPSLSAAAYGMPKAIDIPKLGSSVSSACAK